MTDESNFENDFIFDDFDSSDSHKQILTSQDLSERIEALENQPIASAEDETPTADHNDDSIFDDDSPPGQSSTETLEVSSSSEPSIVDLSYESDPSFSDARLGDLDYEHVIEYARKSEDAQNRFDRASYLGRLTWELISQGEYALAYQVSNCLVVNTDKELTLPAPPPWLLALLVMGDHVRLSSGRIAREFETIVDEHREEAKSITADPNTPEAYLLRAALMRGAVTTASVAAADILRAFSIVPNQTQLYNYCSRVASFASRSNGLRLDQYFYRPGAASTESEARVIRARVISWRPTAFKDILPYDVATPLFSQAYWSVQTPTALRKPELVQEWRTRQVLLAHITRMLQPILDNRLNQSHLVESEIRRLSHSVMLESGHTKTILSDDESCVIPGRELYNHVQEAIEFASHWLVLAAAYPGIESVLVPQEINELRDEIDRRQHSVFVEMMQIEKQHGHHAHRSSLTACRRSMDRISQLFHPREEPRISEQDPLCLLNSVLLKIPGISLEEDWRCKVSPSTLEHQILLSLMNGPTTWQNAFENQLKVGAYRAARCLLKVDAWNVRERQWMTAQLESKRQDSAASLEALASQIKGKIFESRQLEIISPLESSRMMAQLERLEERIGIEYQLDELRNELNQLWQLMENRRDMELRKTQDKISRLQRGGVADSDQDLSTDHSDITAEEYQEQPPEVPPKDDDPDDWAIDV